MANHICVGHHVLVIGSLQVRNPAIFTICAKSQHKRLKFICNKLIQNGDIIVKSAGKDPPISNEILHNTRCGSPKLQAKPQSVLNPFCN